MFMTIEVANFKKQYVAYQLTDMAGKLLFVGISKLTDVLALPGSFGLPEKVNLIVSAPHDDLMRAANDALFIAEGAARTDLINGLKKIVDAIQRPPKRAGRPIECVETNERFFSASAAAIAHGLSYSALNNHLKGAIGFKSVKGKTYKYL